MPSFAAVTTAELSLTSVSPTLVAASDSDQTLTLFGSNFAAGDSLLFTFPDGMAGVEPEPDHGGVEQRDRVHAVQRSERRGRLGSPGREPGRDPVQRRVVRGGDDRRAVVDERFADVVARATAISADAFREQLRRGRQSAFHLPRRHDRVEPPPDHGGVEQRDRAHAVQRSERRGRLGSPGREPGRDPVQRRVVRGGDDRRAVVDEPLSTSLAASDSDQTITLFGSNFAAGDSLLFTFPDGTTGSNLNPITVVSSREIEYTQFNDESDAGAWQVQVESPVGTRPTPSCSRR